MNIGEVLDRLRPDFPDITHPQDPVPRGQGSDRAGADPGGLPQVLPRRRRAAALRAAHAARPLPAAQGHRRAPRRDRPGPRAAADRRRGPARCRGWRSPADGLPSAGVLHRDATTLRLSRRSCSKIAEISEDAARPARAVRPDHAAARHRPLRHRRPGDRPDGRASSPTSASSRGTCAPSRPRPTARSAWSSRSWRRKARPRRRGQGPRGGGRQRDRGAVGAAARDPGEGRPARPR